MMFSHGSSSSRFRGIARCKCAVFNASRYSFITSAHMALPSPTASLLQGVPCAKRVSTAFTLCVCDAWSNIKPFSKSRAGSAMMSVNGFMSCFLTFELSKMSNAVFFWRSKSLTDALALMSSFKNKWLLPAFAAYGKAESPFARRKNTFSGLSSKASFSPLIFSGKCSMASCSGHFC